VDDVDRFAIRYGSISQENMRCSAHYRFDKHDNKTGRQKINFAQRRYISWPLSRRGLNPVKLELSPNFIHPRKPNTGFYYPNAADAWPAQFNSQHL